MFVPYATARQGTPEFERCWTLLDPAIRSLYFALQGIEPPMSPEEEAAAASFLESNPAQETDADGRAFGSSPEAGKAALAKAQALLEDAIRRLPSMQHFSDATREAVARFCTTAQDSIREAGDYLAGHL